MSTTIASGSAAKNTVGSSGRDVLFKCEGKCRVCPFPGALCAFQKQGIENRDSKQTHVQTISERRKNES